MFSNDIVCLAATPVLAEGCRRRGLDPIPYLVGLAAGHGVEIGWRRHAALGVPVTLATLVLAGAWLALAGVA